MSAARGATSATTQVPQSIAHAPHADGRAMSRTTVKPLSVWHNAAAATGGAVISAAVTTPLDVVKTTLQSRAHANSTMPSIVRAVIQQHGVSGLWRGIGVNMLNALPTVGLYLLCYDGLKKHYFEKSGGICADLAPMLSGVGARTIAVLFSTPLESLRTLQMSGSISKHRAPLFAGMLPYMMRDVPFSAVYWMVLESCRPWARKALYCQLPGQLPMYGQIPPPQLSTQQTVAVNLGAGCVAGTVATLFTMPMDNIYVGAIVAQTSKGGPVKVTAEIGRIWRAGGFGGFFRGVIPRVSKIAPSCAIVIASYELLKQLLPTIEQSSDEADASGLHARPR